MMIPIFLMALAAHATAPEVTQNVEPRVCTAEPNFVTKERLPLRARTFRLTGTVVAANLDADNFTPFASLALLEEGEPQELSAVMSVQAATPRRFDVTLRRLINNELRERSIIGRLPTAAPVPFVLEVTGDGNAVFRMGRINERVPLNDLRPSAVVFGCSSGTFRFENLQVSGSTG